MNDPIRRFRSGALPPSTPRLLLLAALAWYASALSPPLHAQTELREGRAVRASIEADDTVRYALSVDSDTYVYGEVLQHSADVLVRILDPGGNQRGRVDGSDAGKERMSGELSEAGSYTIEIIVAEGDGGDFEIELHRVERMATDPEELVDQLMARYDGDDTPGAAIRVWRGGRTVYSNSWGMANLGYGIPFDEDSRTNIGSTSKQFTAFAMMLEQERGVLSLDDDIRDHLPELPAFDESITIRHLLTHTTGLREVFNLMLMTGRRIDHGDFIERDELLDVVKAQPHLQNVPGAEWNYNNTAYGLAATIVERTSGEPFHEYMRTRVFEPLGMTRTMVRPHAESIVPQQTMGYAPAPEGYTEVRDLSAAVGAGAIYSTIEDLQTWVENYATPRVGSPETIEEMMTSFVLNDGEESGYGLGLFLDEQGGQRRVHHGGADIAHRSMLVYYPEIDAGITTQSNHAGFDSNVAYRIAAAFFPNDIEDESADTDTATDFDPESYDPEAFDELAGQYALDAAPTFILTFTRDGDTFYTQATGQQQIEIVPTSDSTFALTIVDAAITFHRNDDGEVDALTLHQNGDNRATRLDDDVAAWEPDAGDLEHFVGRYFSPEVETFFDVHIQDESLVADQRRLDEITLEPGEEDVFSGSQMTFTFERDRNGEVIAFYLDNVRTRDVRFERQR
ncbi:MAG: serine hydrolase [Gemmatimonadota bacterium]